MITSCGNCIPLEQLVMLKVTRPNPSWCVVWHARLSVVRVLSVGGGCEGAVGSVW